MHETSEFSLILWDKVYVKVAYFIDGYFCHGKKNKSKEMNIIKTVEKKTQFEVELSTIDTSSS